MTTRSEWLYYWTIGHVGEELMHEIGEEFGAEELQLIAQETMDFARVNMSLERIQLLFKETARKHRESLARVIKRKHA